MANGNFGGGLGTTELPYLIEDAQDFIAIRNNFNAFYKLKNNVNMSGVTYTSPTGSMTGGLDGDGHTVSNFSLDSTSTILGPVLSATIINITFSGTKSGTTNTPTSTIVSSYSANVANVFKNCHLNFDVNVTHTNSSSQSNFYSFSSAPNVTYQDCSFLGNITIRGTRDTGFDGNPPYVAPIGYGQCLRCFTNANITAIASRVTNGTEGATIYGVCSLSATDCYSSGNFIANTVYGINSGRNSDSIATRCYTTAIMHGSISVGGINNGTARDCFFLTDKMYRRSGSTASLNNFRIISPTNTNCYALQGVQLFHEA